MWKIFGEENAQRCICKVYNYHRFMQCIRELSNYLKGLKSHEPHFR